MLSNIEYFLNNRLKKSLFPYIYKNIDLIANKTFCSITYEYIFNLILNHF